MVFFGVGRVCLFFMYLMFFDEFFVVMGYVGWIEVKWNVFLVEFLFEVLYGKLVESFCNYLMVGGMFEFV